MHLRPIHINHIRIPYVVTYPSLYMLRLGRQRVVEWHVIDPVSKDLLHHLWLIARYLGNFQDMDEGRDIERV